MGLLTVVIYKGFSGQILFLGFEEQSGASHLETKPFEFLIFAPVEHFCRLLVPLTPVSPDLMTVSPCSFLPPLRQDVWRQLVQTWYVTLDPPIFFFFLTAGAFILKVTGYTVVNYCTHAHTRICLYIHIYAGIGHERQSYHLLKVYPLH